MAGESELAIVAEGDTPDGARWQVRAGGTADDYLHAWKVISADGEWDGSGVGGPALPSDGRLVDVYCSIRNPGRPDQGPLRVHVRADPRVRRLHLVSHDGDECDAVPVADDPRVGVTLFFVPTTWMVRLRSVQAFDAGGQPLAPPEPALCLAVQRLVFATDPNKCPTYCLSLLTDLLTGAAVRREDMGDGSAAEDGGAHRPDRERREEDPPAGTQDDRVDHEAVSDNYYGLDKKNCP